MNAPQLTSADVETIRTAVRERDRFSDYVETTSSLVFKDRARKVIAGLLLGEDGRAFVEDLRRFSDAPMTSGIWALGESHEHPVGTIRYEVRTGLVSERRIDSAHRTLHASREALAKLHKEDVMRAAWIVICGTRSDLVSIGMRRSHDDALVVQIDGHDVACEVRR